MSIAKNKTAFSGYAKNYKIEIVDKKDMIIQLKAGEISINELFKDFLNELAVLLSKAKNSNEIEYFSVYFN